MIDIIPHTNNDYPPGLYSLEIVGGHVDHRLKEITIIGRVLSGPETKDDQIILKFYIPKTQWLFNKMCIACGLDNRKQPIHIKPQLIGLKVYVAIRLLRQVYDNGEIIKESTEPFGFYMYGESSPSISGDPSKHNGNVSVPFLRELVFNSKDENEYMAIPHPKQLIQ